MKKNGRIANTCFSSIKCGKRNIYIDEKSSVAIIDVHDTKEVLMKGKVKWFNKNKGYGFILTDDNKEYFVHWKSIVTNSPRELKVLEQDEDVTFDLMETEKGIQAINIIRTNT